MCRRGPLSFTLTIMAPRFAFVPGRWLDADCPLSAADRLVLCILCRYANKETDQCWPSVGTVSKQAKLSEKTVRASLQSLAHEGAITIKERWDEQGDRDTNLYTILGYDPPVKRQGGGVNERPPVGTDSAHGGIQEGTGVGSTTAPNTVKNDLKERSSVAPSPSKGRALHFTRGTVPDDVQDAVDQDYARRSAKRLSHG